ncbi:MAG: hypothetical protein QOE79_1122 [Sphingomonadales bacterium]|jgi:hypothetical protein|nr:hypothetical protein [Sphingomonadales bacterium]
MDRSVPRLAVLAALAAAALPAAALVAADNDPLAMLESGKWSVRSSDGANARELCLGDPAQLVRLEHAGMACKDDSVAGEARGATIQYSCPGHGFGHTSLRIETPRVATIETQGLVDGRPFAYRATARKAGPC